MWPDPHPWSCPAPGEVSTARFRPKQVANVRVERDELGDRTRPAANQRTDPQRYRDTRTAGSSGGRPAGTADPRRAAGIDQEALPATASASSPPWRTSAHRPRPGGSARSWAWIPPRGASWSHYAGSCTSSPIAAGCAKSPTAGSRSRHDGLTLLTATVLIAHRQTAVGLHGPSGYRPPHAGIRNVEKSAPTNMAGNTVSIPVTVRLPVCATRPVTKAANVRRLASGERAQLRQQRHQRRRYRLIRKHRRTPPRGGMSPPMLLNLGQPSATNHSKPPHRATLTLF